MSQENVELVRRALDALDERDLATWLAVHDQDFELGHTPDFPEQSTRGPKAAWDFYMDAFAAFERFPVADVEVVDAGSDKVFVHYRYDLRGKGSGAGVEFEYSLVASIWRGRIVRAQWFADRVEALEAAGLSE